MPEDPGALDLRVLPAKTLLGDLFARLTLQAIAYDRLSRIKRALEETRLTDEQRAGLADAYWRYVDEIEGILQLRPDQTT